MRWWAFCIWAIGWYKITKLESKWRTRTCMLNKENPNLVALFNMPQCVICSPVWRFVPPDSSDAKGPFGVDNHISQNQVLLLLFIYLFFFSFRFCFNFLVFSFFFFSCKSKTPSQCFAIDIAHRHACASTCKWPTWIILTWIKRAA